MIMPDKRIDQAAEADTMTVAGTGPGLIPQEETCPAFRDENGWYCTVPGAAHPLGATVDARGVNFALFSMNATGVELLLFDEHDDTTPFQIIALDPCMNKTFHFWHIHVLGLQPGAHYAFRVDGPDSPSDGHKFNRNKVLIDPYSRGNTSALWNRGAACTPDCNLEQSMRSVVIDVAAYDWEGDQPLRRAMSETIVYELHVGGFTRAANSGVDNPGTFAGLIEKIPYLKALGVTAVELLPVFSFDAREILRNSPDGTPLTNYWGYSTISFFAPHDGYCIAPECGYHLDEFRDMVKALHNAGIEVILDVVFNHTDEGNHQGPVINYKGIDNSTYYHVVPGTKEYYMDYTGCGNTVNCNHPVVTKFVVECLEFWVKEMHIDGFRFDEASVLSRGLDGVPMEYPPLLWEIELSEALADAKIIAEAWDAAGAYQIGHFPGFRWGEWNGRYRDDVRRFVRGDRGLIGAVASRIAGSADIYQSSGHLPINSVNFITAHDGFTLNDMVSYNEKHNFANGEGNRDGNDDNDSWNCGVEGPTDDLWVERLREKQLRNFATVLFLSQGVPMIVMGDEVRRTQHGNNNAYCQDNEISWFDWSLPDTNSGMLRFFQNMIAFRRTHPVLHRSRFFTGETNARGLADVTWHGCRLNGPGWDNPDSRVLAFTLGGFDGDADIHVMMNMDGEDLEFDVPSVAQREWCRVIDTAEPSPGDFLEPGSEKSLNSEVCTVRSRSVVVLISK